MSAGAVGFLSKPLNDSLLISCLESALSPSIVPFKGRFTTLPKPKDRLCRAADVCHAWQRGLVCGVPAMDRISAWIDEKPYRFQLMLLGHTAIFLCAILIAAAHF